MPQRDFAIRGCRDGPGWAYELIAPAFSVDVNPVCGEESLEAAVGRKRQSRPSRVPWLDEAKGSAVDRLAR